MNRFATHLVASAARGAIKQAAHAGGVAAGTAFAFTSLVGVAAVSTGMATGQIVEDAIMTNASAQDLHRFVMDIQNQTGLDDLAKFYLGGDEGRKSRGRERGIGREKRYR